MRTISITLCLVTLVVFSSCNGVRNIAGNLGELLDVAKAVSTVAGTDNVNVNLQNGTHLQVSIINTPLKDLPADQKQSKTLEIARLAFKSYPKSSELEEVTVAFVTHKSYVGVVNFTDTTDVVSFKPSELSEASAAGNATSKD